MLGRAGFWRNTTNTALDGSSAVGDIAGDLAPGSADLFTFVSQDAVPFDTNTTGSAKSDPGVTVTIDTPTEEIEEYTGTCEDGSSGVLGLTLDGGTAESLQSDTICHGRQSNPGPNEAQTRSDRRESRA